MFIHPFPDAVFTTTAQSRKRLEGEYLLSSAFCLAVLSRVLLNTPVHVFQREDGAMVCLSSNERLWAPIHIAVRGGGRVSCLLHTRYRDPSYMLRLPLRPSQCVRPSVRSSPLTCILLTSPTALSCAVHSLETACNRPLRGRAEQSRRARIHGSRSAPLADPSRTASCLCRKRLPFKKLARAADEIGRAHV